MRIELSDVSRTFDQDLPPSSASDRGLAPSPARATLRLDSSDVVPSEDRDPEALAEPTPPPPKPPLEHRWNIVACVLLVNAVLVTGLYSYVRCTTFTSAYGIFIFAVEVLGLSSFFPYAILLTRGIYPTGSPGLPPRDDTSSPSDASPRDSSNDDDMRWVRSIGRAPTSPPPITTQQPPNSPLPLLACSRTPFPPICSPHFTPGSPSTSSFPATRSRSTSSPLPSKQRSPPSCRCSPARPCGSATTATAPRRSSTSQGSTPPR